MSEDTKTESMLVTHARRELIAGGMDPAGPSDDPNTWMAQGTLALVELFSTHGHSGASAPYAIKLFSTLAAFEPWGPITGVDAEWNDVADGVFQNKRCSHVFKQADRFDGQAYDIQARVFREPSGACFTRSDSAQPITFPYVPKTEYVDVPASRD